MKKYNAAIIGCGRIGSEFDEKIPETIACSHAGAYHLHDRTDIISASDSNFSKLESFKKKWQTEHVYDDYRKMLKNEKIDILSICTPPETHLEIVEYAAMFPLKVIYCEKPTAYNVKDSKRMIGVCKGNKILLMINHQRRFHPFYRELKEKISQGFLGDIQQVNCYYARGIFNTGVHIIDLFCFLFGEAKRAVAFKSPIRSPFKNDPNIDAIIQFKNGTAATIKACDDSAYLILEVDILGTKARIRFGNRLEYFEAEASDNPLGLKTLSQKEIPFESAYGSVSLTEGVEHIIRCIENKDKPLSAGEDAVDSIEIIEAILRSSLQNTVENI